MKIEEINNTVDLANFILQFHRPELKNKPGMVYQIWQDGEVTLQKSGELFNQRNLHTIFRGLFSWFNKSIMPIQETEATSYAFVESEKDAQEIRKAMLHLTAKYIDVL